MQRTVVGVTGLLLGLGGWAAAGCGEDRVLHGEPEPEAADTEGRRCPEGLTFEFGHCVDYGPEVQGCVDSRACSPGYVCRTFDVPACVCDPRPGVGDACAVPCTADFACALDMECVAGVCRYPLPCLADTECTAPQRCLDVEARVWYVSGAGDLSEDFVRRHCRMPGTNPDGALCRYSAECASGACTGRGLEDSSARCRVFCYQNKHCGPDEVCLQDSWGPPTCRAAPAGCAGEGGEAAMCRLGTWVLGCVGGDDCAAGDCQFPESTQAARGYGGIGFGVGRCLDERHCAVTEFRSEWSDRWSDPTCFEHTPCRDSADCEGDRVCLPVDALATTERCGRVLGP